MTRDQRLARAQVALAAFFDHDCLFSALELISTGGADEYRIVGARRGWQRANMSRPDGRIGEALTAEIHIPAGGLTVTAAPPALVSQRTCEAHLGIHRRAFLESLPAFRSSGGKVLTLGRLRLVDPSAYLAWLPGRVGAELAQNPDDDGETEAEIMEATGYRFVR